jgi:2-phosphosulfolactate phosphatase
MSKSLDVYLLPDLVSPEHLRGKTVVVIDVLRASTTITTALAVGAREVVPCLEVEEARRVAAKHGADVLLGGEREGLPIDGFDFGNSPAEYTSERVSRKTIVFTTTNGTKAMQRCTQADLVLIGAFVNLSATCRVLLGKAQIALVCAGTCGEITAEDVLFAGAVVNTLESTVEREFELNDQARLARDAWQVRVAGDGVELSARLRQSQGGRNLARIGMSGDIDLAANVDAFDIVPQLDTADWRIYVP